MSPNPPRSRHDDGINKQEGKSWGAGGGRASREGQQITTQPDQWEGQRDRAGVEEESRLQAEEPKPLVGEALVSQAGCLAPRQWVHLGSVENSECSRGGVGQLGTPARPSTFPRPPMTVKPLAKRCLSHLYSGLCLHPQEFGWRGCLRWVGGAQRR